MARFESFSPRTAMYVSRCRFWWCAKCHGVFEKEDLALKIKLFTGAGQVTISGTRECANCHSIYQSEDIYAGKHDVPRQHWGQLPEPVELPDEQGGAIVAQARAAGSRSSEMKAPSRIGSTIGRCILLIGLPLLGWWMVQAAWRFHVSSDGVPGSWILLFLGGLGASILTGFGVGLFAVLPPGWRGGASQNEIYLRYGVVLAALLAAVIAAIFVASALNGTAYNWFLRIDAVVLILFALGALYDMRKQQPAGEKTKGKWKVECKQEASSPWLPHKSYRDFLSAQIAAGMMITQHFKVRVLDPHGEEAWHA